MSPKLFFGKPDLKKDDLHKKLALALDARVDFNMDFFMHKRLALQLKGVCTELRPDAIKVYLRGDKSYVPPAGMQVHVYFSIREGRKVVPHDFLCELLRTEKNSGDPYLLLSMPDDIGHNQRRNNVRIDISRDNIPCFQAWYGKPVLSAEGDGPVRLEWVPFEPELVDIFDLSAGGAQLAVSPASALFPLLSMREMLLVGGTFEAQNKTEQLLIAGAIVRIRQGEGINPSNFGIRFKRWAARRDGKYHWLTLAPDDGIPPLGAWVFHTILTRGRLEREALEKDIFSG